MLATKARKFQPHSKPGDKAVSINAKRKVRAAAYARFSTEDQDSNEDQLRDCGEEAKKLGLSLSNANLFSDEAITGAKRSRPGLNALIAAIDADRVDVVIVLSASRLYRTQRGMQEFIDHVVDAKRKRVIFIQEKIDTDREDGWRLSLGLHGMFGQLVRGSTKSSILASPVGLALHKKVHGTLAFGYCGTEVAGAPTRRNRPRREIDIDPVAADWVKRVLTMYAFEGMTLKAIAKRLNAQLAPPPAKAKKWSWRCVKRLIRNRRYVGDWSYGLTENRWQVEADYSRQFKRVEGPFREHFHESLRIVDDELFERANIKLDSDDRGGRGRSRQTRSGETIVDPLRRLLNCPLHGKRKIRTGGAKAELFYCSGCKDDESGVLYSMFNRKIGLQAIFEAVVGFIRSDEAQVEKIIGAAEAFLATLPAKDGQELAALQAEEDVLEKRLSMLINMLTDEEDVPKLERVRKQRNDIRTRIRELTLAQASAPRVPMRAEVEAAFADIEDLLAQAAKADDDAELNGQLFRFFNALTGGTIELAQAGAAQRKNGWLQAKVPIHLVSLATGQTPATSQQPSAVLTVDIRQACRSEIDADDIKKEFDRLGTVKAVVNYTGKSWCFVWNALTHWHKARGLPLPLLPKGAPKGHFKPDAVYSAKASEIWAAYEQHKPLGMIASEFSVDRATIDKSLKHHAATLGVALLDGRKRRELSKAAGYRTTRKR